MSQRVGRRGSSSRGSAAWSSASTRSGRWRSCTGARSGCATCARSTGSCRRTSTSSARGRSRRSPPTATARASCSPACRARARRSSRSGCCSSCAPARRARRRSRSRCCAGASSSTTWGRRAPPPAAASATSANGAAAAPHAPSCFCRCALVYFRPDGRVAAARVHAAILKRSLLLPERGAGGLRCLRAVLGADDAIARDLGAGAAAGSRYLSGGGGAAALGGAAAGRGGGGAVARGGGGDDDARHVRRLSDGCVARARRRPPPRMRRRAAADRRRLPCVGRAERGGAAPRCQPDALGRALGGGAAAAARREAAGALRQLDALATWLLGRVFDAVAEGAQRCALASVRGVGGRRCRPRARGDALHLRVRGAAAEHSSAGDGGGALCMIESYAAEKTHARMCDAMRDALRSQPEAEGIEPPQLPLPGTSSAELLALFDGPSGLLHLLGECEAAPPAASAGPSSLEAHLLVAPPPRALALAPPRPPARHRRRRVPPLASVTSTANSNTTQPLSSPASAAAPTRARLCARRASVVVAAAGSSSPPAAAAAAPPRACAAAPPPPRSPARRRVASASFSNIATPARRCTRSAYTRHRRAVESSTAAPCARSSRRLACRSSRRRSGVGWWRGWKWLRSLGGTAPLLRSTRPADAIVPPPLRRSRRRATPRLTRHSSPPFLSAQTSAPSAAAASSSAPAVSPTSNASALCGSLPSRRVAAAARGLRVRSAYRRFREAARDGGGDARGDACRCVRVSRRRVPDGVVPRRETSRRGPPSGPPRLLRGSAPLRIPCCRRARRRRRRRRRGAAATATVPRAGADVSNDVAMRAIERRMDLKADRSFLWLAAEALERPSSPRRMGGAILTDGADLLRTPSSRWDGRLVAPTRSRRRTASDSWR